VRRTAPWKNRLTPQHCCVECRSHITPTPTPNREMAEEVTKMINKCIEELPNEEDGYAL
jgi:galactose-1-phosphate uridylyltransferase